MYKDIRSDLKTAYDLKSDERDKKELTQWKKVEREKFLERIKVENKTKLPKESWNLHPYVLD